jgi:hypothetical protein
MSQDYLSMEEVDLLLKGVTNQGEEPEVSEDAWAEAMSEVDARKAERKVRYPDDGVKLTRDEMVKWLVFKQEEARHKADRAHAEEFAYMNVLEMLGSME